MELREFAERVLFSATLEEKLAPPPADLRDDDPGQAIGAPGEPGRPVDLRLAEQSGRRADFPRSSQLIDEEQRGVLMHFFANHELLATELMALVLLKFPDAPRAFRRDILATLKEEQIHTQWYLKRMADCGVDFGCFRLSGFFWQAISTMESPLDYVTRLSLTFEQANLDYSRHYAKLLTEAGDAKTGKILDRIYRDEIAHVGHGLKWFRRWKRDGDSDWQAFGKQLHFPLSPVRAKAGNVEFNREGRRRAGLDDDFIEQLEVFNRSAGRSPNVFYFEPAAENDIAGITNQRGATLQIARDLEILIAGICRRDDIALVREIPDTKHLAHLKSLGLDLPDFEKLSPEGQLEADSLTRERKLSRLRPWAWCPRVDRLLEPLAPNLTSGETPPWGEKLRSVFSKTWAAARLGELGYPHLGITCHSVTEFEQARAQTGGTIMIKAPFGASGQKNHRLDEGAAPPLPWVERTIAAQGGVIVEPFFDRVFDFSAHYELGDEGLRFLGMVRLENDSRGQFVAATSTGKFCQNMDQRLARFLMGDGRSPYRIFRDELREILERALAGLDYRGPIGVDAFVYHTVGGELALRPVVEVNPRYTMGRVAYELRRRIAPEGSLRLDLKTLAQVKREGFDDFSSYAGSAVAGVALNDPHSAKHVLAEIQIDKTAPEVEID